jgi:hypothetical protein
MSALRTDIRAKMIELVAGLTGFNTDLVSPHKLDKVEKGNEASVYLDGVDSEPVAMRGNRKREQRIAVSLFLEDATDAAVKGASLINELEVAVETARRASAFGNLNGCSLESANFAHDPQSRGTRCDVHAVFLFEFTETLI